MISIYNTLTNQKEVFKPLVSGKVSMYVCGPTVYNYIHIGNARSAIAFDTIRRYFEYRQFKVNYVSNFTDVDDKMIKAAKEDHITVQQLADKFIAAFMEDTKALAIEPATKNPKATENIDDIIQFILNLIDKGYAYESDGDVYFRTRKSPDYGKLSDQNINELEQGASQHVDNEETARKEDEIDFALWKSVKNDDLSWNSPFGKGRPGWHIECSVMATKYLGPTIDIHGGGQDLMFPHHENEIAQSEAETGQKFANYWMHNGFVTIGENDEKMSKSLGNFVTVHDMIKEVDPQVIRFFMATTHYRRPIQYSQTNIDEATNNLNKLKTAFDNLTYRLNDAVSGEDQLVENQINESLANFENAMDDDFNSQNGIAVIYDLAKKMNVYSENKQVKQDSINHLLEIFKKMTSVFGLAFGQVADALDIRVEKLISQRIEAKKQKDFQKSDEIRDQLAAEGIILEDTPQGTRWRKD
ncbi:cysteine--tRNA ligase [Dellaglioa sp. P0083]|uniref:cysteine--tRNA ligase n=1 Tax=Dellaglioa kimchii TaxID=3344667 RepID=UPI0038D4F087